MKPVIIIGMLFYFSATSYAGIEIRKNPLDDPLSYPCQLPHNPVSRGCAIDENICYCGVGCKDEFMFDNIRDCRALLASQEKEPCVKNPCNHGGKCSPRSEAPFYSCNCDKTGYHGSECQNHCPWWESQENYPSECSHLIGV